MAFQLVASEPAGQDFGREASAVALTAAGRVLVARTVGGAALLSSIVTLDSTTGRAVPRPPQADAAADERVTRLLAPSPPAGWALAVLDGGRVAHLDAEGRVTGVAALPGLDAESQFAAEAGVTPGGLLVASVDDERSAAWRVDPSGREPPRAVENWPASLPGAEVPETGAVAAGDGEWFAARVGNYDVTLFEAGAAPPAAGRVLNANAEGECTDEFMASYAVAGAGCVTAFESYGTTALFASTDAAAPRATAVELEPPLDEDSRDTRAFLSPSAGGVDGRLVAAADTETGLTVVLDAATHTQVGTLDEGEDEDEVDDDESDKVLVALALPGRDAVLLVRTRTIQVWSVAR